MPAAARSAGDRDAAEAVEEGVAGAAGPAVPALGRRDRCPAAMASGQADRRRDRLVVHPYAPPVGAVVHLEHGHLGERSDREGCGDLVVGRAVAGLGHFVIDVAAGDAGKAAVADLDPLVRAVRALARAADADPGGAVA